MLVLPPSNEHTMYHDEPRAPAVSPTLTECEAQREGGRRGEEGEGEKKRGREGEKEREGRNESPLTWTILV